MLLQLNCKVYMTFFVSNYIVIILYVCEVQDQELEIVLVLELCTYSTQTSN